jgi:hypothetical protein
VGVDTNIVYAGILIPWSGAQGIMALAATRVFQIVLLAVVQEEVERLLAARPPAMDLYQRWRTWARPETCPAATTDPLQAAREHLSLLRHVNDLPVLAEVLAARPDWFLSDNTAHFSPALALATGLHFESSIGFLRRLRLPSP